MKKLWMALLILPILLLTGCNFLPNEVATTLEVDLDNYYNITSVDELKEMTMNQSYQLMNDLDLAGEEWTPIGAFDAPYQGNFNGNGYTISNFTITENHLGFNGLFGYVEGDIENLNVTQFMIDIDDDFLINVGGLAGVSYGSISQVNVDGDIFVKSDFGNIYAGLLVGQAMTELQGAVVDNALSPNTLSMNEVAGDLSITATQISYIGGLVGKSHNVLIDNNKVNDILLDIDGGSSVFLGGLVGHVFLYDFETMEPSLEIDKTLIKNNIVQAEVEFTNVVESSLGGLVGYSQNTDMMNNAIELSVDLDIENLSFGLLVGENWVGNLSKNIVILSAFSTSDSDPLLGDVVGVNQSEDSLISGYLVNQASLDFGDSVSNGSSIDSSDLLDDDFYQSNFPDLSPQMIADIKSLVNN